MGVDALSIVSMNSSRKGLLSLSPSNRTSYLQNILENAEPDLCFLPGDKGETGKDVVIGYQQYMSPTNRETVLLYKAERIKMSSPSFSFNSFGELPLVSYENILCPLVNVETLAPNPKHVIKQFSAISWHYQMCDIALSKGQQMKMSESLVILARMVAMTTRQPVLVCGEFPVSFNEVMNIVKEQTKQNRADFLQGWQEELGPHGYLPSMTNGATRDMRHRFELKGFRCKALEKNVNIRAEEASIPDFFLASKELELKEPSLMNVEKLTGRKVQMKALLNHCPTRTEMKIPVREPRHHGG